MAGALQEIFTKFTVQFDESALQRGSNEVEKLSERLNMLGNITAIAMGIKHFALDVIEAGGRIDDMSQRLGISVEEFQRLDHAARMSGIEEPMAALQVVANKLAMQSGATSSEFRRMGVSMRDEAGNVRPVGQVLGDVAGAMEGISDPAERSAALVRLFGRQGAALAPLLGGGRDALNGLMGEVDEFGALLSAESITKTAEAGDQIERLSLAYNGLKSRLLIGVLPAITKSVEGFGRVVGSVSRFFGEGTRLNALLSTIGFGLATLSAARIPALIKSFAPFAGPIAIFWLLYLAIDDVMTALDGGDSVIGRISESIQEGIIPAMKDAGGVIGFFGGMWEEAIAIMERVIAKVAEVIDLVTSGNFGRIAEALGLSGDGAIGDMAINAGASVSNVAARGLTFAGALASGQSFESAAAHAETSGAFVERQRNRALAANAPIFAQAPVNVTIQGDVRDDQTVRQITRTIRTAQAEATRRATDAASIGGR